MPLSALQQLEVDHVCRLEGMAQLLAAIARGETDGERTKLDERVMEPRLTDLTCPDCRGTIWEVSRGNGFEYQCRVGHVFSPKTMLAQHFEAQEKALYAAKVALEEGAALARRLVGKIDPDTDPQLSEEARNREREAALVKKILDARTSFSLE